MWSMQWGADGVDEVAGIAVSGDDFVLVAGHVYDAEEDSNVFATKRSLLTGKDKWSRRMGSSSTDVASAVAVDSRGDSFVVGQTRGSLFGRSNGGQDAFLVKLGGGNGTILWSQQLGTPEEDSAFAAASDASGDVFVCGTTAGQLFARAADSGAVDASAAPMGAAESYCAKYRADGRLLWGVQLQGGAYDGVLSAAVDPAGDLAIAGYVSAADGPAAGGRANFFVSKLAGDSGRVMWAVAGASGYSLGDAAAMAPQFSDAASAVAVDAAGDVVAAGYTEGRLFDDGGDGGRFRRPDVDGFVVKVSGADGRRLWGTQLTSMSSADSSSGSYNKNGYTNGYKTGYDGGFGIRGGGSANANVFANAVSIDASGDVITCGSTAGTLFDAAGGGGGGRKRSRRGADNGRDVFLAKLDGDTGRVVWGRQFGDIGGKDDRGSAVATLPGGDILAAGCTRGELFLGGDPNGSGGQDMDGWMLRTRDPPPRELGRQDEEAWGSWLAAVGVASAVTCAAAVVLTRRMRWRRRGNGNGSGNGSPSSGPRNGGGGGRGGQDSVELSLLSDNNRG